MADIDIIALGKKYNEIIEIKNEVIQSGNLDDIFQFALNVPFQEIVDELVTYTAQRGDPYHILLMAKEAPNANKKELERAMIKKGDAKHIYHFAIGVEGADILMLKNAEIVASFRENNFEYLKEFAKIPKANINIEDYIPKENTDSESDDDQSEPGV